MLNKVLLSRSHLSECQVHELAIIVSCGAFLHILLYRIKTVLQQLAEGVIADSNFVPRENSLFEITFDDGPQGFDAVEFGSIGWHKHQLEIEFICHSLDI